MKRLAFVVLLLLCPGLAAAWPVHGTQAAPAYVGFLDQYPSAGATWGFSTYKLNAAYAGNWGVIENVTGGCTPSSTCLTTTVGFNTSSLADPTVLTGFCTGFCNVTTIYDQVGSHDATCVNVRAFIAADGRVAVSPGPSASCSVPYSSAYSTAKQEIFLVGALIEIDNRPSQPNIPTIVTTGTVTQNSATISAISSLAGVSVGNRYGPPLSGVTDSANCLISSGATIGAVNYYALGTNTATLQYQPGNIAPVCTHAGDTLTFSNAPQNGVMIMQGPASATAETSAYWAFGFGYNASNAIGDAILTRNGSSTNQVGGVGESIRQTLGVWDYDTYTGKIYYDGSQINSALSNANITYSTNVGLKLFSNANGSEAVEDSVIEQMVLINQTFVSRVAADAWLQTQFSITPPPTSPSANVTSDGFTLQPQLMEPYGHYISSPYGAPTYTDALGNTWAAQTGGYTWPSLSYATNINNGGTMFRSVVEQGDSDTGANGLNESERAEWSSTTANIAPGQHASFFYQFEFEQLASQTGDWCTIGQTHYNNANGNNIPDIVNIACNNNHVGGYLTLFESGNACGSPLPLVVGHVYAIEGEIYWSSNETTDTLDEWIADTGAYPGNTSTTLVNVCHLTSGSLFANDTGAYAKAGLYRGYPYSNAGTAIVRTMNYYWSNTANAFAAYRTSQPALPTHP